MTGSTSRSANGAPVRFGVGSTAAELTTTSLRPLVARMPAMILAVPTEYVST